MQIDIPPIRRRTLIIAGALLVIGALLVLLRHSLLQVVGLVAGAAFVAFLVQPLCALLERRLKRPLAALLSLLAVGLTLALLFWLVLPSLFRELTELAQTLPQLFNRGRQWLDAASTWLEKHLPGVNLPRVAPDWIGGALSRLASGGFAVASNIADLVSRASLTVVLAYFFLSDRERLLLRLELLLPQRVRGTAVRMGNAILRELRSYFRGQLLIAACVSALASAGLALAGVRSALVLGTIVGVLNLIPYFGPLIGGIPAVVVALGDGITRAGLALLVLGAVQQLDNALISPRVMGSVTGLSPAGVLVAIFAGARLWGLKGMLFALPVMVVLRTLFRVFVQRYENI